MAFSKALYYPTIDIEDWNWLKSAALYWDEIQTIVPESIERPYEGFVGEFLAGEGILTPLRVQSDHHLIRNLGEDVAKYLQSPEATNLFLEPSLESGSTRIHIDKLPREFRMNPEKLPWEVQDILRHRFDREGWFVADDKFGLFYMSLLANRISEQHGLALVTDNPNLSNLAERARMDAGLPFAGRWYDHGPRRTSVNLAQGMLMNLIIQGINFSPETGIEEIVAFRKRYPDELGRFRTEVTRLVSGIPQGLQEDAVRQYINDIFQDQFIPARNALVAALNGSGIRWVFESIFKISFLSMSASAAFLPLVLGLSTSMALLVGAGVSVTASRIAYSLEKEAILRTNPYAYTLAIDRELNRRPPL